MLYACHYGDSVLIASIIDCESTGTEDTAQVVDFAHMTLPETPGEFLRADLAKAQAWQSYHGHDVPMNLGAQATHHILPETLKGLPLFVKKPFDGYVVGHNVDFDADKCVTGDVKPICTLALSRFLFTSIDSHTQSSMLYFLAEQRGVGMAWARDLLKDAHSAAEDVKNCARLLKFLLMTARTRGHDVTTWESVYQLSELARIPTVMGFSKEHKGKLIADVDPGFVAWYVKQPNTDKYYIEAFKRAHLL